MFVDKRKETHQLKDSSFKSGLRELVINPDLQADFTALPFENSSFSLVVFDPPHLIYAGKKSWLAKKYGKLGIGWQDDFKQGFSECFRVLKINGVLIFKWNEYQVPVSEVLKCTEEKPLFGHISGKASKTHWITFMKNEERTSCAQPQTASNTGSTQSAKPDSVHA